MENAALQLLIGIIQPLVETPRSPLYKNNQRHATIVVIL